MDLITIIDIAVVSQGILLGTLILLNKPSNQKAYTFLALHVLLLSLLGVSSLIEDFDLYETYNFLYFLPFNFLFAFPVFLYLYAREISGLGTGAITWKRFLPGLLELLVFSSLLGLSIAGISIDIDGDAYSIFEGLYLLGGMSFAIYYLVKIIRFVSKVNKAAENSFSSLEHKTLSWLRVACIMILVIFALDFSEIFMEEEEGHGAWLEYFDTAVSASIVLWLAFHGYRQTVILNYQKSAVSKENDQILNIEKTNESKVIPLEGDRKLYEEIVSLVEEKELYKKQELTLNELAKEAGIHQKQLSFLINQFSEMNFFNFINGFRVSEAQELLIDDKYAHLSFIGIAFEAGFNSKATFNATFKRVTGQTPRQYKMSKQSA